MTEGSLIRRNRSIRVTRCVFVCISAGGFKGEGLRSNSYNVIMIGDSSVGKTSFMKRAQSGKFSLDLPASVGKILIFIQQYCQIVCKYAEQCNINGFCRTWFLHVDCGSGWKTCGATVVGYSGSRKVSFLFPFTIHYWDTCINYRCCNQTYELEVKAVCIVQNKYE